VAEHLELTQVKRPQVIERIVRARELGDLKENADYTSAREEQSFLEGRVQALEAQLRHAVIVATPSSTKHISLGSRVTAEANGDEVIFEIVGHSESNPAIGKISTASPVGKAMLGREVGDEAIVATPRGAVSYRILAIE
jgi:transcription elongation factor GreA